MVAVLIFVMAVVAMLQFLLCYRRAILEGVSMYPISEDLLASAGIKKNARLSGSDFPMLTKLCAATPELFVGRKLAPVKIYYYTIYLMSGKLIRTLPMASRWCERELANCSHYAAAELSRILANRLETYAQSF